MKPLKILTVPHPLLRHQAKPITKWNKKTTQEIQQMINLLNNTGNPKGIGLAATQVGLNKRLFIINFNHQKQPAVFINPKIIQTSKKMLSDKYKNSKKRWLEGCLSIPQTWGFVNRPYSITLQYQIPESLQVNQQKFSDTHSSYIQHELDHLNGILFTDHILKQNGTIYQETKNGLFPLN